MSKDEARCPGETTGPSANAGNDTHSVPMFQPQERSLALREAFIRPAVPEGYSDPVTVAWSVAEAGWPVIPLVAGTKKPAGKGGVKHRDIWLTSGDEVLAYAEENGPSSWGVILGEPNAEGQRLIVLDPDSDKADERLRFEIRRAGAETWEALTMQVKTSRGRHIYGMTVREIETGRPWPDMDVKASGFVVLPWCKHPSGDTYKPMKSRTANGMVWVGEDAWTTPMPMPQALLDVVCKHEKLIDLDLSRARSFAWPTESIADGARGTVLFKCAAHLLRTGLDDDEALERLREAYALCVPTYTDRSPEAMWAYVVEKYGRPESSDGPSVADRGKSWGRLDLRATVEGLRAGTIERPTATIGRRLDGVCLFYKGRVNGLYGDSTAGKTWTALLSCAQVMAEGHRVVFIDFEDDELGTVERLMALGVPDAAILDLFIYLRPEERFSLEARERLGELIGDAEFVVIDSTGESMAIEGTKPNDDDDVARWVVALPKWIARRGAGVLLLDHLAKSSEGGLWAIGSQRKRAAINGAAFVQETMVGFAKGQPGFSRLKCSKDRRGGFATSQVVAELHVRPGAGNAVLVELREGVDEESVKQARMGALMESICRVMMAEHQVGKDLVAKRWVRDNVTGGTSRVSEAWDRLEAEGYIRVTPRGARVLKPFVQVSLGKHQGA